MSAHTIRIRPTGRHPHVGATSPRIPRRLSPRRTARIMGVRVRPFTRELIIGLAVIMAAVMAVFDFDMDPTFYYPGVVRMVDWIGTVIVTAA